MRKRQLVYWHSCSCCDLKCRDQVWLGSVPNCKRKLKLQGAYWRLPRPLERELDASLSYQLNKTWCYAPPGYRCHSSLRLVTAPMPCILMLSSSTSTNAYAFESSGAASTHKLLVNCAACRQSGGCVLCDAMATNERSCTDTEYTEDTGCLPRTGFLRLQLHGVHGTALSHYGMQ